MIETVRDVVKKYLEDNEYDGLLNNDWECCCDMDDLIPCDMDFSSCEPGYKVPCDCEERCPFHISTRKPEPKPMVSPGTGVVLSQNRCIRCEVNYIFDQESGLCVDCMKAEGRI